MGIEIEDPGHLLVKNREDSPIEEFTNSQSRFVHYAAEGKYL